MKDGASVISGVGAGVGAKDGRGVGSAPTKAPVGAGVAVGANVASCAGRRYQLPQRVVFFSKPLQVGVKSFLEQPSHAA
jgi:hypothetical protein